MLPLGLFSGAEHIESIPTLFIQVGSTYVQCIVVHARPILPELGYIRYVAYREIVLVIGCSITPRCGVHTCRYKIIFILKRSVNSIVNLLISGVHRMTIFASLHYYNFSLQIDNMKSPTLACALMLIMGAMWPGTVAAPSPQQLGKSVDNEMLKHLKIV